jgi:Uma2 family endonuclease
MKPTGSTAEEPLGGPAAEQAPGALPVLYNDLPVLYEDEGQEDMGESTPHTDTDHLLTYCLRRHFRSRPQIRVLSNLNVYYHPVERRAYISPDVMVVQTAEPLPESLSSYRIGPNRPAPLLVIEILSPRSAQQQDLTNKPIIYASLGVAEYILIDSTGQIMPDRLLLKRRVDEETWEDEQDRDGGVTSKLGFRILIEDDALPRVIETASGRRYRRPEEAEDVLEKTEAAARKAAEKQQLAEQRIRDLETELRRLRSEQAGGGDAR